MRKEKVINVTELNHLLKTYINNIDYFDDLYVSGEIGNFSTSKTGHVYFNLKDENAIVAVNVWKSVIEKLDSHIYSQLKEGAKIIVQGKLDIYERGGTYNLIARKISFFGEGDLALQFLKTKRELEELGLFAQEHKKPTKRFNYDVGLITSKTGAVLKDITSTIKRRFPNVKLKVYNTIVQGQKSEQDIIQNLLQADKNHHDVIIIARGGGSLEDLFVFNSKLLALEIFNAQTPIISAVGHETDTTICDLVADKRAPTPTAAAELLNPHIYDVKQEVRKLNILLSREIKNIVNQKKYQLLQLDQKLLRVPNALATLKTKLNNLQKFFTKISYTFLKKQHNQLNTLNNLLNQRMLYRVQTYRNSIIKADEFLSIEFLNKVLIRSHNDLLIEKKRLIQLMNLHIYLHKSNLNTLNGRLNDNTSNFILVKKNELKHYYKILEITNPNQLFKRGFFYLKKNNKLVNDLGTIRLNDKLVIYSNNINIETKVEKLNTNKE